jgi:hypothetical protein
MARSEARYVISSLKAFIAARRSTPGSMGAACTKEGHDGRPPRIRKANRPVPM